MGRNKARLPLGSLTFLQHVRAAAQATGFPVRVIRKDQVPACGPLGGIFTALNTTRCEVVVVLACDMPFVTAGLLKRLIKTFGLRRKSMFVHHDGLPGFPLLLHRATLPVVARNIDRRRLALHELAASLRSSVANVRRAAYELVNVNTPREFKAAKASWTKRKHRADSGPGRGSKRRAVGRRLRNRSVTTA